MVHIIYYISMRKILQAGCIAVCISMFYEISFTNDKECDSIKQGFIHSNSTKETGAVKQVSGIIEKITLYDLLGYALPGSMLLGMTAVTFLAAEGSMKAVYNTYKGEAGYIFTVLLILGYAAGMAVSEITDIFTGFFKETLVYELKQELQDRKINVRQAAQALKNAGYISQVQNISSTDQLIPYIGSMYGDIQTDTEYSRLHNYASARLICKNMAFVCCCGAGMILALIFNRLEQEADLRTGLIIAGLSVSCGMSWLFIRRWKRMYIRTQFYTVVWFMEKYTQRANHV